MGKKIYWEDAPKEFCVPGDLLMSPGGSFTYEVLSYPLCRLYYDHTPNAPLPIMRNGFEWYTEEDGKKDKTNYSSYIARMLGGKTEFYITDKRFKKVVPIEA